MRDGLYRACEAYAAGALHKVDYTDVVRQYQSVVALLHSTTLLRSLVAPSETAGTVHSVDSRGNAASDNMDRSADSFAKQPPDSADIAKIIKELTIKVLYIGYQRTLIAAFRQCVETVSEGRVLADSGDDDRIGSASMREDDEFRDGEGRIHSNSERGAPTWRPLEEDKVDDQESAGDDKQEKHFDCRQLLKLKLRDSFTCESALGCREEPPAG